MDGCAHLAFNMFGWSHDGTDGSQQEATLTDTVQEQVLQLRVVHIQDGINGDVIITGMNRQPLHVRSNPVHEWQDGTIPSFRCPFMRTAQKIQLEVC